MKINPFPSCTYVDFSLKSTFYLPQHLDLLKKLRKDSTLEWDFSSKPPGEQLLYRRIYKKPWFGNLEILFYGKPGPHWINFLPKNWFEQKIQGLIPEEEFEKWEEVCLKFDQMQNNLYQIFEKRNLKERRQHGQILPTSN